VTPRQRDALLFPLNDTRDPRTIERYRRVNLAGDGAQLIIVLAVDR
jgi:hypothetical protein